MKPKTVNEFCEKYQIPMEGREELEAMLAAARDDTATHQTLPPAEINDGAPPSK